MIPCSFGTFTYGSVTDDAVSVTDVPGSAVVRISVPPLSASPAKTEISTTYYYVIVIYLTYSELASASK